MSHRNEDKDEDDTTLSADKDLDSLLNCSAPQVSTGSPAVRAEVHRMVRASAAEPRQAQYGGHGRSRRRVAVGAGAAAFALMGVTAAAASPVAPAWMTDWIPDATVTNGVAGCGARGLRVMPEGTSKDDPAVVAAREYLAGLDVDDVDFSDELAAERATPMTGEDGTPTGKTAGDLYTEEELEAGAYVSAVSQMVWDEVHRQGFESEHVSIESRGEECAESPAP